MPRYRTTTYLDALKTSRVISDAQLVARQALPHALPTIERTDVIEYVRHSNLSNAHREYLLNESLKATAS